MTKSYQHCIEDKCGANYDINARIYTCPRCGGLLDVENDLARVGAAQSLKEIWDARLHRRDARDMSGVWRFRELLPFDDDVKVITLNEGNTTLFDAPHSAAYCGLDALTLKHQGLNPTGSFKDNGMTVAVTQAKVLKAKTLVCASTGNTSASLAAYAARADLQCAILIPRGQISAGKLAQSLDYGAHVLEIDGNFDDAMRAVCELGEDESIYVVNSINPFRIEGQKTIACELAQQLAWDVPDYVVVPGGNLGHSAALGKGFKELHELGLIKSLPRLIVVQAEDAAPFAHLFAEMRVEKLTPANFSSNEPMLTPVAHPNTLATAIKIGAPVSWKKSLRSVLQTGGAVLSVSEQEIADAKAIIGRDGIGCEPASATTVAGIKRLVADGCIKATNRVVAILTGHMLKDADYIINYHRGTLELRGDDMTNQKLTSTFANTPARVAASKEAILEFLQRRAN